MNVQEETAYIGNISFDGKKGGQGYYGVSWTLKGEERWMTSRS